MAAVRRRFARSAAILRPYSDAGLLTYTGQLECHSFQNRSQRKRHNISAPEHHAEVAAAEARKIAQSQRAHRWKGHLLVADALLSNDTLLLQADDDEFLVLPYLNTSLATIAMLLSSSLDCRHLM